MFPRGDGSTGYYGAQARANGALFGNPHQLLVQIVAVVAVGIYAFVATRVVMKVLGYIYPPRVTSTEEEAGLDVVVHGEPGYRF